MISCVQVQCYKSWYDFLKEVTTSTEKRSVNILKQGVTIADFIFATCAERIQARSLVWKPLLEMPSAQKKNRKNYVIKNSFDCYYVENEEMARGYFGCGSEWASLS